MTKEEVKQICQIYDNLCRERDAATIVYNSDDTFWDHILATYNLSQPSLSSNLDEVTIPESEMSEWMKYGPHTNYPWCSVPDAIKITAEHFFALGKQAGAELMAGHYEKIEGDLVDWYSTSDGKDYCCGVKTIDSFEVPEGFYIRKN